MFEDLDKNGFVDDPFIELLFLWPFVGIGAGSRKLTDSSHFFVVELRSLRFELATKNFVLSSWAYLGRFSTF